MHKFMLRGIVLAIVLAIGTYLMSIYGGRHPNSAIGQGFQIARHIRDHYLLQRADPAADASHDDTYSVDDDSLTAPEEPEPASPESPTVAAALDLKGSPPTSSNHTATLGTSPDPEAVEDPYRTMPPCKDDESSLPDLMPYAPEEVPHYRLEYKSQGKEPQKHIKGDHRRAVEAGGSEEQEWTGPNASDSKSIRAVIERHASELFSPGTREGKSRFKPGVDTLEFRSTDANPGEFDPIEY